MELDKKEYLRVLKKYESIVGSSIMFSDSLGGIKTSTRYICAVQLYTKLTLSSMSIMRLLPHNTYCSMIHEIWDFASIACLTRSFLETYNMFFYIGVEQVSKDELDFRLLLMNYHRNYEKYKMYKGHTKDEKLLEEFEKGLPLERKRLSIHKFISTFSEKQQSKILKGDRSTYLTQSQISARIPFCTDEFEYFYRFYSNHTHSSPLGFMSQTSERGRGFENIVEREYLIFAMNIVGKYLAAAIIDISKIFPKQTKHLKKDLKNAKVNFAEIMK